MLHSYTGDAFVSGGAKCSDDASFSCEFSFSGAKSLSLSLSLSFSYGFLSFIPFSVFFEGINDGSLFQQHWGCYLLCKTKSNTKKTPFPWMNLSATIDNLARRNQARSRPSPELEIFQNIINTTLSH